MVVDISLSNFLQKDSAGSDDTASMIKVFATLEGLPAFPSAHGPLLCAHKCVQADE